jgi:cytoskeletal protein RodZ
MALTTRTDGSGSVQEGSSEPRLPVGAELRARRIANKAELAQIANKLRIRATFLEAIEEMDYKRLPGLPYAIGFVRSYADFLGFDAGEMVARFKSEAAGIEARAPLIFPSPAPQGKVPGPLPLTIALIVALGIAGSWYFWRDGVSELVARVPEVPDRLAALTRAAEKPPKAAPSPVAVALPAIETPPAPATEEAAPPPPSNVAQPVAAATLPAPTQPPSAPPPEPTPTVAPPQASTPLPALAVAPPAAPDSKPAAPAPVAAPKPAKPIPNNDMAATPEGGKIYGAQNQATRIVIKARGDSWLQVRDKDSQVLLTRVLHDGDSYRVPDQEGLQMSVGNAGAIELVIDGKPAPSLGQLGVSRRAVALDAERLSKGVGTGR